MDDVRSRCLLEGEVGGGSSSQHREGVLGGRMMKGGPERREVPGSSPFEQVREQCGGAACEPDQCGLLRKSGPDPGYGFGHEGDPAGVELR